jgi:hypothetical protein
MARLKLPLMVCPPRVPCRLSRAPAKDRALVRRPGPHPSKGRILQVDFRYVAEQVDRAGILSGLQQLLALDQAALGG